MTIFAKSVRDRWASALLAGAGVSLLLLFAMAVYAQIDTSFYYELPVPFLEAAGISAELGGVGGIAYGAMYNLMGAMAVAGIAISIGAAAIAGEERDNTLGLLLGNPKSRSEVLAAKLAALIALVALAGALLWGAGVVVPAVLGVDISGVAVGALVLHLAANAVCWGLLALAIGAWTGNRGAAVGGAAGVMVLSWLATSFLPLIDSVAGLAKAFPWYYFNASQPEINGVSWAHLGVLLGLSAVLGAVAVIGFNRRDLRGAGSGVSIVDRLRAHPRTKKLAERVAGSARVSGITAKTISDHQGLLVAVAAIIFYLGLMMGPFYNLLPATVSEVFATFPDALLAAVGGVDMSTPTGWLQGEVLATVLPIAVITLFASVGARALAGEEQSRTMSLLLANPIPRARIVRDKVAAMLVYAIIFAVATFAGTAAGVVLGGLNVSLLNLAATAVLGALLGLVFGGVALVLSAGTGKVKLSVYGAAGLGLFAYFVNSFFPLAESFSGYVALSPFHYFLGSDPLVNGMNWADAAILSGSFIVLVAASIPLFQRRDLRG